jgi:hypothetical protein
MSTSCRRDFLRFVSAGAATALGSPAQAARRPNLNFPAVVAQVDFTFARADRHHSFIDAERVDRSGRLTLNQHHAPIAAVVSEGPYDWHIGSK